MLKLCAAILIAATAVLAQPIPPTPLETVWEGMFAPPYIQNPQMVLAMSALSSDRVFLAGGSNGVGFGVFEYNGKMDGQITGPMNEPNQSLLVMDLQVSGTPQNPTGVFSSVVDFTIGAGLQYLANKGTEWLPANMPLEIVWASQSISGYNNGQNYVAVGNGFTPDLMLSNDGGLNYRNQAFTFTAPNNCTAPSSIATPSANAWFLTYGVSPSQNSGSNSGSHSSSGSGSASSSFGATMREEDINGKYHCLKTEKVIATKSNGRVLVIKNIKNGKIRVHVKTAFEQREDALLAANADSKCNYYWGAILKSTDQGKTWTKVYENKNAATSFIQCFDDQSCTAIAFNAAESYTLVTNDGNNWKITLTTPPISQAQAISLGNIAYASKNEVWVGGSRETQSAGAGMFWSSKDGGQTWTQYPHYIPDVMVILALSFAPDGTGFAVGLTQFKTTQIMRYKKQADYGNFVQSQCPTAACNFLCQNLTFPQGMCLSTQGGSVKAFCLADGIVQYSYATTSCVGSYSKSVQPINQCLNATGGSFFENYCPSGSGAFANSRVAAAKDMFLH